MFTKKCNARQGRRLLSKSIYKQYFKPLPRLTKEQIERLFDNVVKEGNGCWNWTKYRDSDGYGRMAIGNEMYRAHRLAWVATHGKVPRGLCVLHKCDNPSCINPAHLFLGTQYDNIQDCIRKMRRKYVLGE